MLVGDLIYNDDFDINCNYTIYNGDWHNGNVVFSYARGAWNKPLDTLLDKKINYITLDVERNELVIETEVD
ncbi:MAG: hypothetical protein MJZ20_11560 [Bacteroidaceae bacterium]|nr:hypothetical protein [Bacteroidaceae bacterium]